MMETTCIMAIKRPRRRGDTPGGAVRRHRRPLLFCSILLVVLVGTMLFESAAVEAAVAATESHVSSKSTDEGVRNSGDDDHHDDVSNNKYHEQPIMYEEHDDDHHRSLWLKEFLANYLKRKPTSSPSSTMVIVSAPLTSQKPTSSSKPTTSQPTTTSSPTTSQPNIPEEEEPNTTTTSVPTISKAPTPTTTTTTTTKPTRKPRTKNPTSKPSSKEQPTFKPTTISPSESLTIVTTAVPTTYSPTTEMTEVPSISASDNNPTTSPSTSMMPTVMAAPKLLVYFPAKFGTLIYCMHGNLSDPHVQSTMPPANDEVYTTMCDCCSAKVEYDCHSNFKADCPTTHKPTTSVTSRPTTYKPTKTGETTVPSVSSTTNPPTLPQMYLYYPVKLDNDTWCVFGDHNDVSFLTLMPPSSNETYTQLCDCCAQDYHKCHHVVEKECAPPPVVSTGIPTSSPTIVDPTNVETDVPTHNPTTALPTTTTTTTTPTRKPSSKQPTLTTSTPSTKRPTTSMPLVPFSSPITIPSSSKPTTLNPTSTKPTLTSVIPVVHHCDVVEDVVGEGEAYWYPHEDDDDKRGCAIDAEYPVGFYDNDALCHSFLFATVDDCCLKFPDSCSVSVSTGDVIKAMWYPEVFTSSSNIKLLECIPGSDYPSYMTLPENAHTHLFDTEDDCCIHIPCGKKLVKYWYPVADVAAETVVCKFDNDYPIYMLVDTTEKKRLFTNETECVASWGAALHHCDADDGQGQEYWYPHEDDDKGCALDAYYPSELYNDNALCMSFLFKTLDECCLKFPDSCLVPTVNNTKMKWYPEMFISKSKIKMFHCISGNDYPVYMSLPENDDMYLFDSQEECCSVIPCGERLPMYWFPVADADTTTVVCRYDIDYPLYMMKSTDDTYLFANEADCIATWAHEGLSSASPSLYPSTSPTTSSPSESPSLSPTMEETESPSLSPSMEPSESPSLIPSMEPTGVMDIYFYPRQFQGKTYCTSGPKSDVTALVGKTKQEANEYLSSTLCECCAKHSCFVKHKDCTLSPTNSPVTAPITPPSMSPTNNPTSATSTAITKAAIPEHQFYPMQYGNWRVCTAAKPYPTNAELFPDICACCKKHECSWDMTNHCGETSTHVATPSTPPAETTTASPTFMATTAITTAVTPEHQYYPVQLAPGWKVCMTAKPYPINADLSADVCECCKKHGCTTDMSHCDVTNAPVAAPTDPNVTITASPTGHQFYPVGGGNVITCISAHPYPDNVDLYSDICQCCKEHGCTINLGDHCDEMILEPTSTPSFQPTKLPSKYHTSTPLLPTEAPSKKPTNAPSKKPIKAPSDSPLTSVPTNKPTVNTSKDWYYPETYSGKQYCMHGTIANVPSIASMNPIDLYETLCDCCAQYTCDIAHHEQCHKTKPTTSSAPTAITSHPPITSSKPTSNDVIAPAPSPPPSEQWYFHPVHMGEHDWCAYDILTNNTYMQSLKPEELYTSMCACCENHKCPEYVVTECVQ